MNALTLTLIRLAFLAVLWLFVIAAVGVVRTDLFGPALSARQHRRQVKAQQRPSRAKPARAARPGKAARAAPNVLLVTSKSPSAGPMTPHWCWLMTTLRADMPGCSPRTGSGSWRISDPPTARILTGRR